MEPTSRLCRFFCGPEDGTFESQQCHNICDQIENCAVTPNMLYTLTSGLVNNRDLFLTGVYDTINERLSSLNFRLSLYQQIPWFLAFAAIMIILVNADIISLTTATLFVAIALLALLALLYLSFYDTSNTLQRTFQDAFRELQANVLASRDQLGDLIGRDLFISIGENQVPCGCQCPF